MKLLKDLTSTYGDGLDGDIADDVDSHFRPIIGTGAVSRNQLDDAYFTVSNPAEWLFEILEDITDNPRRLEK